MPVTRLDIPKTAWSLLKDMLPESHPLWGAEGTATFRSNGVNIILNKSLASLLIKDIETWQAAVEIEQSFNRWLDLVIDRIKEQGYA